MKNRRLLLLSNSKNYGQDYLEHALPEINDFLGREVPRALFIPFAAVRYSFDQFAASVRERFLKIGYRLDSIHEVGHAERALRDAEAIVVGGGNTFHLLYHIYKNNLLESVRARVGEGIPYIGWSAGSNVACPTIKTTNDMPIIEPPGFAAFGLVPFQINPHYLDAHPEGHQGETREERIQEFIEVNPNVPVVGLREGCMLRVEGDSLELIGDKTARVFIHGQEPKELGAEDSFDFLL